MAGVTRDNGTPAGVRPLGASVNFGKPLIEAQQRLSREDINVEQSRIGPLRLIARIFREKVTGNEVVFVADVEFAASALVALPEFEFTELDMLWT